MLVVYSTNGAEMSLRYAILQICMCICVMGCRGKQPEGVSFSEKTTPYCLRNNNTMGGKIEIVVPFRVSKGDFVQIASIHSSCSCVTIPEGLIGQSFGSGEHSLSLFVRPTNGAFSSDIFLIDQKDRNARQLVRGYVFGPPTVSPDPIICKTTSIKKSSNGIFAVSHIRLREVASIEPIKRSLLTNDIKLSYLDMVSIPDDDYKCGMQLMRDEFRWKWELLESTEPTYNGGDDASGEVIIPIQWRSQDTEFYTDTRFSIANVPPLRGLTEAVNIQFDEKSGEFQHQMVLFSDVFELADILNVTSKNPSLLRSELSGDSVRKVLDLRIESDGEKDRKGEFLETVEIHFKNSSAPYRIEVRNHRLN